MAEFGIAIMFVIALFLVGAHIVNMYLDSEQEDKIGRPDE